MSLPDDTIIRDALPAFQVKGCSHDFDLTQRRKDRTSLAYLTVLRENRELLKLAAACSVRALEDSYQKQLAGVGVHLVDVAGNLAT